MDLLTSIWNAGYLRSLMLDKKGLQDPVIFIIYVAIALQIGLSGVDQKANDSGNKGHGNRDSQ
jgi:hypothetical protein